LEPGQEDDRTVKDKWAISTFRPFKSATTNGIVPALLQHGVEHLALHLCRIFRACLACGYIPKVLRQTRVTFIPKPRKPSYTEGKACCSISMSSFISKMMEKLVDRYIWDDVMRDRPLHQKQFAYQAGRSTEIALHNVAMWIENAMAHKKIALGAFFDIEGVFDRTSFAVISEAPERHGVESTIVR
jgi:hypothetical protein